MTTVDFNVVLGALAESPRLHAKGTYLYTLSSAAARQAALRCFSGPDGAPQAFGPFGDVTLPYTKMGAIDSVDLFGLDELIIFAFYHANRGRYRRVLDVGANLGLHSIVMARCGYEVRAFEPDPWHFGLLQRNIAANGVRVDAEQAAISCADGTAEFVRVLGNTTGSHLAGAKNSYGELETFSVATRSVAPLLEWADLAKIDIEGHERDLLLSLSARQLDKVDLLVEIGNAVNAEAVFEHLRRIGVGMFAQKKGWRKVEHARDVPTSHREGSLFITTKGDMPWSAAG